MPDVVYRVVQTVIKTVDITIPQEVVSQGFEACKKYAVETAIVFHFTLNSPEVQESGNTKAFIRLDGL